MRVLACTQLKLDCFQSEDSTTPGCGHSNRLVILAASISSRPLLEEPNACEKKSMLCSDGAAAELRLTGITGTAPQISPGIDAPAYEENTASPILTP